MKSKPNISDILKKGAKLAPRTLTEKDLLLIEKTVKEQEKVLALKNIPDEIYNQRITI